jgi:receptor protein-tyrosine kinase
MRIYSTQRNFHEPVAGPAHGRAEARDAIHDNASRIGQLLVAAGVLTTEQAEQVAGAQQGTAARYGETAVALGFATQSDVDVALANQFNFAVAAPGGSDLDPTLITAHGRRDRAAELIRSLRANLSHVLEDWPDGETPAVTVASTTGSVGRRLITANLAIAAAQAGIRTLLVDADLRSPALHRLFAVDDQTGLSTWLAGRHARPHVRHIEAIPGLFFLPAGPTPPNPAELLAKLEAMLPKLRSEVSAGLVLFNTPPLDAAEDLFVVAAAAPAVLLVVRRHFTHAKPLAETAGRLHLAGATIVGSVLNVA